MPKKNLALAAAAAAALTLGPAAWAATPSFTYAEVNVHHSNLTGAGGVSPSGNSWGASGSFDVWNGLFVSGDFNRYSLSDQGVSSDFNLYHADAGYALPFADTLAVYGKLGWARVTGTGSTSDGYHAEVGIRANLLSILELRASYGRYDLSGGLNDYAAAVQYEFLPMFGVDLGYDSLRGTGSGGGNINTWKLGLRWSW